MMDYALRVIEYISHTKIIFLVFRASAVKLTPS